MSTSETHVWSLDTGSELHTLKIPISGIYTSGAVSTTSNGKYVLIGNNDGSISEWDLKTGELQRTPQMHEKNKQTGIALIEMIYITPDGKHICSIDNNHIIKIWGYSSGQVRRTQGLKVWTLIITPDGKKLIQAQTDTSIVITDLLTRKNINLKNRFFWQT